ncbi:MAG: hypothetical protein ABRQ38_23130 [Candidatus Eremiobacterota bacterium]
MFRTTKLYTCMAVVLAVICVIFLSNCGGGGNSAVVPNTNPTTENPVSYTNPTPTPVLSNVNVSGYLYVNNTVTEDGEIVPSISVLDVPACQSDSSGNESFLTQFSNSIKADYPEDWAKADIQELYAQLNKTLSESKPLPEYNVQAQLCSAYDDTSVPIGSDGHFDNTVLIGATDSNVKLEVALGEDNYAEVETLPSSGSINSSDATGAAVLKSCPEKIFAFPGEIIIFKVYSEPGINLKSAGLKFTLNNASIGCITQPVYLCLFGSHKYQVAYSCVYIKPGLDTPVDTTITARLNSGQSMNIFLEVIKKTASVSGTVYTGGSTLVKGYVKSLGPKACCKIDASGNYSLPKVFRGHSRSVIATWWTSENGKKVRHREEKVIDFFNSDLTGFNFGVPPTPTPTWTPSVTPTLRPRYDEFYEEKIEEVICQYEKWEAELGKLQANQRTIQWLNGQVSDGPPIPDEISGAASIGNPYDIWVIFKDGRNECISTSDPIIMEEQGTDNPLLRKEEIKPFTHLTATSNNCTVKNADVIMLSPYYWQKSDRYLVELDIRKRLEQNNYDVKYINTDTSNVTDPERKDIDMDWSEAFWFGKYVGCYALNWDNIVTPKTFETIGKYGIIYINAHGGPVTIDETTFNPDNVPPESVFRLSCTILAKNRNSKELSPLDKWTDENSDKEFKHYSSSIDQNKGWWFYRNREITMGSGQALVRKWVKELALTNYYFDYLNAKSATNFEGSLVYWGGCCAWHMKNSFNTAKVYIGYDRFSQATWAYPFAYNFFWFMMYGPKDCPKDIIHGDGSLDIPHSPMPLATPSFDIDKPLHATEALNNALTDHYKVNPDPAYYERNTDDVDTNGCTAKIWQKDSNEHIYFPVPVTVTVHKK